MPAPTLAARNRKSTSLGSSLPVSITAFLLGVAVGRLSSVVKVGTLPDATRLLVDTNTLIKTKLNGLPSSSQNQIDISQGAAAQVQVIDNDRVKDFVSIATQFRTDKVAGPAKFQVCTADNTKCERPHAVNPQCRVIGHFYGPLYQRWLGDEYSRDATPAFQFLEIGLGQGRSVPTWEAFLPSAERHYMDVACHKDTRHNHPPHLQKLYNDLDDQDRLHCGSSADFDFLYATYRRMRQRPDAPPLRIVVDDASHIPQHMAAALWFWLPRLEPGGLLFLEDIEPNVSNRHGGHRVQTDLLPQLIHDVHYCGDPQKTEDPPCFPNMLELIQSVHCDLHVCVIERTRNLPAFDPPREDSIPPPNALNLKE